MSIKRFNVYAQYGATSSNEHPEGDWMRFEDVAELISQPVPADHMVGWQVQRKDGSWFSTSEDSAAYWRSVDYEVRQIQPAPAEQVVDGAPEPIWLLLRLAKALEPFERFETSDGLSARVALDYYRDWARLRAAIATGDQP